MTNTDLTFITNKKGKSLRDRFNKLVKDVATDKIIDDIKKTI